MAPLLALVLGACATQAPPTDPLATPGPPAASSADPAPAPVPDRPPRLTASAAQLDFLRDWAARENRLYQVAAPLLIANTALCKRHARMLAGFTVRTRYSYSHEYSAAAQQALGLDERLQVTNVMAGSGAQRSGLQPGDILYSLQGRPLPVGAQAERDAAILVGQAMDGRDSINVTVLRGEHQVALDVPLTRACALGIELGDADFVNSYADHQRVMVTRGMLDYVRSDEELAYVLAKEMAHAILAQGPRPAFSARINSLLRFSTAAPTPGRSTIKPYSPVADSTADKLAMYMLVGAGHPIDNVATFWRNLATRYPAAEPDSHTALHPSTAYRLSVMNAVRNAIRAKQKNGMPLQP